MDLVDIFALQELDDQGSEIDVTVVEATVGQSR